MIECGWISAAHAARKNPRMDRAMEMEQQGRNQIAVSTTGASGAARPRPPSLLDVVREDFVRHSRNPLSPGFHCLGRAPCPSRVARCAATAATATEARVACAVRVGARLLQHRCASRNAHRSPRPNKPDERVREPLGQRRRRLPVASERHAGPRERCLPTRLHSAPTLCNGVQVGANAVIIGPVVIGEGAADRAEHRGRAQRAAACVCDARTDASRSRPS